MDKRTQVGAHSRAPLLTIALPKGRLLGEAARLFSQTGYLSDGTLESSRRLVIDAGLRFMLVKAEDVPTYVAYGAADLGIAGDDVIAESGRDVYQPLHLGFGRSRLVVAAPRSAISTNWRLRPSVRAATKYPRLARQHFLRQGLSVEIVPLRGSIELAPAAGLADLIVDMVETGRTLRENGLVEIETVLDCEACLIVNRASHKLRLAEINEVIERLEKVTKERANDRS